MKTNSFAIRTNTGSPQLPILVGRKGLAEQVARDLQSIARGHDRRGVDVVVLECRDLDHLRVGGRQVVQQAMERQRMRLVPEQDHAAIAGLEPTDRIERVGLGSVEDGIRSEHRQLEDLARRMARLPVGCPDVALAASALIGDAWRQVEVRPHRERPFM